MDLFDVAAEIARAERAPLPARMRPSSLDGMVGQEHLLGPGRPLRILIEQDGLRNVILWGPAGTGKTTLARVAAEATARAFVTLSAVSAGVKDVREIINDARRRLGERGRGTILFLDEIHRFNKAQQDALLPAVEDGTLTLIGATTENPYFEINSPLLSRASLFRLEPLSESDIGMLIDRAADASEGLAGRFCLDPDARMHLVDKANGDARRVLVALDVAAVLAAGADRRTITLADAESAADAHFVPHDKGGDNHYDVISAFIKSMRGGDADASLYWLARMLAGGEDPRFIARRLVIFASEDIGLADPAALGVAVATAHALDFVGLPEARLNLAQAAIYMARAPKSRSVYEAIGAAAVDVTQARLDAVPEHLRSVGLPGGRQSRQSRPDFRPANVTQRVYYTPSGHGADVPVDPVL